VLSGWHHAGGGQPFVEYRLFGILAVTADDGQPVYLASTYKPRLMLALLLSRVRQPLTVDWLITHVAHRPPVSARHTSINMLIDCAVPSALLGSVRLVAAIC
jgi:hypothetical protein